MSLPEIVPEGVLGDIIEKPIEVRPLRAVGCTMKPKPQSKFAKEQQQKKTGASPSSSAATEHVDPTRPVVSSFPSAKEALAAGKQYGLSMRSSLKQDDVEEKESGKKSVSFESGSQQQQPTANTAANPRTALLHQQMQTQLSGPSEKVELPPQDVMLTEELWEMMNDLESDPLMFVDACFKYMSSQVATHRVAALTKLRERVLAEKAKGKGTTSSSVQQQQMSLADAASALKSGGAGVDLTSGRVTSTVLAEVTTSPGAAKKVFQMVRNIGGDSISAHAAAVSALVAIFGWAAPSERDAIAALSAAAPDDPEDVLSENGQLTADDDEARLSDEELDELLATRPAQVLYELGILPKLLKVAESGQQDGVWFLICLVATHRKTAKTLSQTRSFMELLQRELNNHAMYADASESEDFLHKMHVVLQMGLASKRACTGALVATRNALFANVHQLLEAVNSHDASAVEHQRAHVALVTAFGFLRSCARFDLDVVADFTPLIPALADHGSLAFLEMLVLIYGPTELQEDLTGYITSEMVPTVLLGGEDDKNTTNVGKATALQCLASWTSATALVTNVSAISKAAASQSEQIRTAEEVLKKCCLTSSVLETSFDMVTLRGSPSVRQLEQSLFNYNVVRYASTVATRFPMTVSTVNAFFTTMLGRLVEVCQATIAPTLKHALAAAADNTGSAGAPRDDRYVSEDILCAVELVAHGRKYTDPAIGSNRAIESRLVQSAAFFTISLISTFKHGLDAVEPHLLPALNLDASATGSSQQQLDEIFADRRTVVLSSDTEVRESMVTKAVGEITEHIMSALGNKEDLAKSSKWVIAPLLNSKSTDALSLWAHWFLQLLSNTTSTSASSSSASAEATLSVAAGGINIVELFLEVLMCQLTHQAANLHKLLLRLNTHVVPKKAESRGDVDMNPWIEAAETNATFRFESMFSNVVNEGFIHNEAVVLAFTTILTATPSVTLFQLVAKSFGNDATLFRQLYDDQWKLFKAHNNAEQQQLPTSVEVEWILSALSTAAPEAPISATAETSKNTQWKLVDLSELADVLGTRQLQRYTKKDGDAKGAPAHIVMLLATQVLKARLTRMKSNFEKNSLKGILEDGCWDMDLFEGDDDEVKREQKVVRNVGLLACFFED